MFWLADCKKGIHKFESRYDIIPPEAGDLIDSKSELYDEESVEGLVKVIKSLTQERYVADVCVKCGKMVMRDKWEGVE